LNVPRVGRVFFVVAFHEIAPSADDSHRQSSAETLAVGHQVGAHAEVLLRTPASETKAHKHFIENENDPPRGAHRAQLLEPRCVSRAVEMGTPSAIDQARIGRRVRIRVHRLYGIHEHAGDIPPRAQDPQRCRIHVLQRVGGVGGQRVAHSGLHVPPPAMVRTAEAHEVTAARVIAREAHGLHHGLGARHVERHFVESRYLAQPPDIVGHQRMIGTEHRSERAHLLGTAVDALLVEVVAEEIHSVGATHVEEAVAVDIGHGDPGGGLEECATRQVLSDDAAELKGHPIAHRKLQVRHRARHLAGESGTLREALCVELRELSESRTPPRCHFRGRIVRVEEPRLVVFVVANEPRQEPRETRVSAERGVLGTRKQQPQSQTPQCEQRNQGTGDVPQQHDFHTHGPRARPIAPAANYFSLVTTR